MEHPPCSACCRWAGASLALMLSLVACTETKSASQPSPPLPPAADSEARDYSQYTELRWSDEFDGSAVDPAKWGYDLGGGGWGNNELEHYTNSTDNAYLASGSLVIEAKRQNQGNRNYTSARLLTKGKQDFNFGRVDVRAKMPQGKGLWPAIWMLGSDIDQNNWPACGEIDIMELRGQEPNKMLTTVHFGNNPSDHRLQGSPDQTLASGSFADAFHLFSVVRSKDQMRFYLDGSLYYTLASGSASPYPFNKPFFLVLNVAVGGNFLGPTGNPDASTAFPQQMQVDYVRYYQYK